MAMICCVHTLLRGFFIFLDGWGFVNASGGARTGDVLKPRPCFAKGGRLLGRIAKPAPFETQGCGTLADLQCTND